jgi:hypothetical protein
MARSDVPPFGVAVRRLARRASHRGGLLGFAASVGGIGACLTRRRCLLVSISADLYLLHSF